MRRRASQLARIVAVVLTAVFLGAAVGWWVVVLGDPVAATLAGIDLDLYLEATRRWLAGGGWYEAWQLTGPYRLEFGAILYPPPVILLFLPFLLLPGILWWLAPAVAVAWSLARLRPAWWSWPIMAACLAWPHTGVRILSGNPAMWGVAALALGGLVFWSSAFVLLKPTLAPFALLGIRHRAWWVGLAALGLICVAFLPMWPDYVAVLTNAQDEVPAVAYSMREWPMLLIPVAAYVARTRRLDLAGEPESRDVPNDQAPVTR